jgi:hypothetical protein
VTTFQDRADLGAKPFGRQTHRIHRVEPDGPPAADLGVQRERQRFKGKPVARGRLAMSLLELLEQVGRNDPSPGRRGSRQTNAFELAQAASRHSRHVALTGVAAELIDAAVGGGDLGEVSIDRPHGRFALGPERDQISDAQAIDRAGASGNVVGIALWCLDHGVERSTANLVTQALSDDAPDDGPIHDAALTIREPLTGAHHMEALGVATVQDPMHLLEDVASGAELAELVLPTRRQRPRRGPDAVGKPESVEVPQACEQGGFVDASRLGLRPHLNALIAGTALKLAVE